MVKVSFVTIGAFQENSYLLIDEPSGDAVLIDPGARDPKLLALIEKNGVTPRAIWLTHAHVDHIGGIAMVKEKYDIPIHLNPMDRGVYDAQSFFAESYNLPFDEPPPPDRDLTDGDILTLGETRFNVIHTPGHSPGHVIFQSSEIVMGGDLLFAGSIGRTDLPLGSPADMDASLKTISALPPHLTVYPGHGPSTTIEQELRTNPFLNRSAYVKGYSH